MFFSPVTDNDQVRENGSIKLTTLDKDSSLAEYYEITKLELAKVIPGFVEISNEQVEINGEKAQKVMYK